MKQLAERDLERLWIELARVVHAEQPLPQALEDLTRAHAGSRLGDATGRLSRALDAGKTLSQAIAEDGAFPPEAAAAVEAGQRGRDLAAIFDSLADSARTTSAVRESIVGAALYPLLIAFAAIGVMGFMHVAIVPMFERMFRELDVDLPILTTYILHGGALLTFIAIAVLCIGLTLLYVLPEDGAWIFRPVRDSLRLGVPVMGSVLRRALLARWCGAMSILIQAGVPEPVAVRLAGDSSGHAGVKAWSVQIAHEIDQGAPLAEAMSRRTFFPPPLVWMVDASHRVGGHAHIWPVARDLYQMQGERLAHIASVLLRLLFILLAFQTLGGVIIGLFLPLFKLTHSLGG